jgi:hypothetical protein
MIWVKTFIVFSGWILTIMGGHDLATDQRMLGFLMVLQGGLIIASGLIR